MATTITLKPNAIDISGSTSGTTTLQATAVAGTTTVTLPAATDTLVGKATTDTLTNKTLTSPVISGGTVNNASVGATTASTGAFTTLAASSTLGVTGTATFSGAVVANGNVTLGNAAADTVTVNGTTNFVVAPTVGGVGQNGFKNRLINSDMRIDQRNAGASVTPTGNAQLLDRWQAYISVTSKFSVQQNAGSVTPPAGFSNYLGVTSLSAYSVGSSDYFYLRQAIEGFNFADMAWGTSNAKTVTLSFQVYSSLTGTFGGALSNSASSRSYPFSYSVPVANTWTTVSVTIAGDTTGTWIGATNGVGLQVLFSLGTGTTYSGTAGAWAGSTYVSATGATSVVGTSGATFYVTGVQLEKGSTATSFDYRPYGTELALCQRYYYQVNGTSTQYPPLGSAYARTTTIAVSGGISLPVTMRTAPTLTATNTAGAFGVSIGSSDFAGPTVALSGQVSASSVGVTLTVASGSMTVGQGGQMYITNNAAYFVGLSAEL